MTVQLILRKPDEEGNTSFTSNNVESILDCKNVVAIRYDECKIFYTKRGNIQKLEVTAE